ncbi:MAG: hypothetical protein U0X73_11490 [Thermoanaerobaculia bacterium]
MRRIVQVRKTTLANADDSARDRLFWQGVSPVERFLRVFQMSEEAYAFVGKLPPEATGSARRVARVVRLNQPFPDEVTESGADPSV